jgi:galactonate dehydratase
MKITDLKTVLLTGPLTEDPSLLCFRKKRSAAFIEVHTDAGIVGLGETYTGYHAPELVPAIVEFFKPILVGLTDEQLRPQELWRRMQYCANFWARAGLGINVLAGIEGALWDLRGRLDRLPVYELLGGRRHEKLLGYATGSVSNYPWDELAAKVERYRAAGFRAAKFAAGWYRQSDRAVFSGRSTQSWVEMECEKLTSLRQAVGDEMMLCYDGHMGNVQDHRIRAWDVGLATSVLRAIEPFDITFFEEPLDYHDIEGYAELCKATSIPIAGGENLSTFEEFLPFADRLAFDIAQPDAAYLGLGAFVEVAHAFAARRRRVATHAWSAGIGVMQNIHAAFASPNVAILELPPLVGPLHREVYAEGYRFEDGYILPPDVPGLGVSLTDDMKNRYPFVPGSGEWNPVPGKSTFM